jgi:hypothetical protein
MAQPNLGRAFVIPMASWPLQFWTLSHAKGFYLMSIQDSANSTISEQEISIHRRVVVSLFLITFFLIFILSVILLYTDIKGDGITILPVVVFAGVLGGFVSALRRIYKNFDVFPIRYYQGLFKGFDFYVVFYSAIPALVGAICAALLYVAFTSGIVSGTLFPEFNMDAEGSRQIAAGNEVKFSMYLSHFCPKGMSDYGKAIVWGFIAGFSEALVPNLMQSLSTHMTSNIKLNDGHSR